MDGRIPTPYARMPTSGSFVENAPFRSRASCPRAAGAERLWRCAPSGQPGWPLQSKAGWRRTQPAGSSSDSGTPAGPITGESP